ncbi:MAG: GNAT family N-acetyltransferase [Micrococcales bacterium]|nr:GNAT family N-acetyltransferase [Micrococcales bacterium]MCL2666429.1 GNAT family N-acetyltransferase [Micrococcales bacterium]
MPKTPRVHKRPLQPGDKTILLEATLIDLNWNETRFCEQDVLSNPQLAHYATLVPERGDFGVVALDPTSWLGVVWVLFLPPQDPGYGFVEPGIPELCVCVQEPARGAGLGRELINDAISIARTQELQGISLSVEAGNPARHLYESLGFVDAATNTPGTMVLRF